VGAGYRETEYAQFGLSIGKRQHLAAYQIPVRFIFLEELPRTPSLKLNIARLKELLAQIPASSGSEKPVAPLP
jgi:acyl-CoA synthetase (AMP-forming)/AMP-acid ligase II